MCSDERRKKESLSFRIFPPNDRNHRRCFVTNTNKVLGNKLNGNHRRRVKTAKQGHKIKHNS